MSGPDWPKQHVGCFWRERPVPGTAAKERREKLLHDMSPQVAELIEPEQLCCI